MQRNFYVSAASDSEPDPKAVDNLESIAESENAQATEDAAQRTFVVNVIRMSIMWTAASFSTYLLQYLDKYLAGTIFTNYYLDAAATVIALLVSAPVYARFMTRISFLMAFSFTFIGASGVYLLESR